MGWSNRPFSQAKAARDKGEAPAERICLDLLRKRGDAHCQELGNAGYRKALQEALALCSAPKSTSTTTATKKPATVEKQGSTSSSNKTLVDCAQKRFRSGSSAKSLMGWSKAGFKDIEAAQGTGNYPEHRCKAVIDQRGDAHCQQPTDTGMRTALQAALTLCNKLKNPAAGAGPTLVDCTQSEYKKNGTVARLIRSGHNMSADLTEWSAIQAKARCTSALGFVGAAHCKLPADPAPKKAYAEIKAICAKDVARRQQMAKASADADSKAAAERKANRILVTMPRSDYKGGGAGTLARQMKSAMVKSAAAKSSKEILKLVPMGRWQDGRYGDTRVQYRKINGMVLWYDKDNDGVCRFTTYKFVKDKKGSGYGPLRFQAFCNGCAEGWTKCK